MATVFLVDDDASVRDAVGLLLQSAGFDVQAFASGREFIANYDRKTRGCLILDYQMPDLNGLEVQQLLSDKGIHLPIIMLTAHGNIPVAVNAVRNGAFDFIEKPFDDETLIQRVEDAIARHVNLEYDPAERARIQERVATLSERELQVMEKLVAGKWVKLIASELGTSPNTVKNQRTRLLEKMEADSVPDLVRMVLISQLKPD